MNIPSNNSTAAAVAAAPVTAVTAIPFESRDEDDTGSACSSNSSRSSNSYASRKVAASSASAVGLEKGFVPDIQTALETLHVDQVGFIACNLFHPRFRRDVSISDQRMGPKTRSDMLLSSNVWTSSVVGKVSPWIHLDAPAERVRKASEKAFLEEVAWATHLSVPVIIVPTPDMECANYANKLHQVALQAQYLHFWVRVPLYYPSVPMGKESDVADKNDEVAERTRMTRLSLDSTVMVGNQTSCSEDPWDAWCALRTLCEYNDKLSVLLEITNDLPCKSVLDRWLGEPIKAAVLPIDVFLTNRKGYPTLSNRHQELVLSLFKHNVQFMLRGRPRHYGRFLPYVQYLDYLKKKSTGQMTPQDLFEHAYLDYLQAPLQPLMDNLESQTYETFEKDPIKYAQYEKAVTAALLDTPMDKESVVMVVGAGRGPLVKASLRAAATAKRKVRMYAVEKNPNAVITLRNMKITEGWDNVTIVACDMREWNATEKADIMVSELLGSFGDNELSPECLDGAQRFLNENGISIPSKYTSFIAPLSSSKLWNRVKDLDGLKHFETAYVVRLHNIFLIDETQPCFEFEHPKFDVKIDNTRYTKLVFQARENAIIHGLGGYFDAELYGGHRISIEPKTFSTGMFSWFPLYIPLRSPQYVNQGEKIVVHMWRKVANGRVWYEWSVGVANQMHSPIHNPNGRSAWIGL